MKRSSIPKDAAPFLMPKRCFCVDTPPAKGFRLGQRGAVCRGASFADACRPVHKAMQGGLQRVVTGQDAPHAEGRNDGSFPDAVELPEPEQRQDQVDGRRRPQSGHKVLTRATERILPMLLSPSGVHGPQPAGFGKKGVKAHSQPARPAAGRSVVRDKSQCYKKGLWKLSNKGPGRQLPTRKIA